MCDPFASVLPWEYKDKNFFPCITDEYHKSVRSSIRVVAEDDIEAFKAMSLERDAKVEAILSTKGRSFLKDPFELERPSYRRKNNKQPRRSAEEGCVFDLMEYFQGEEATSLVRCLKDGDDGDVSFQAVDPVASLKGKYVLVVCPFVPSKWCSSDGERLCRLWVLSKEIASNHDFEILIVVKMRNEYQASLAAFKQFFSGFPNRLAISFDHPDLRDELCYNLDFHGKLKGILIDPHGIIVKEDLWFLGKYGVRDFPFTSTDILPIVGHEDMSLGGLLRCDPSTSLYKFGFPSESITIEQLSKKLVWFYVFRQGDKFHMLNDVYRLCQLRDIDEDVESQFEIVLFCLPVGATDPATFEFVVHELLNKLRPGIDASSWWICPYDSSAAPRLVEKCRWFYCSESDALFSIGADGEFVDFCAGELLRNIGYEAYPFSLKVLIQRFVERVDEVTFESLFTSGTTPVDKLVKQDSLPIGVKELQRKNVILYFDSPPDRRRDFNLEKLIEWYPKIKQHEPDVEVVFVPYTAPERGLVWKPKCKSEIPWIVCPYEPDLTDFLEHHSALYRVCDGRKMVKGLFPGTMVAFGKGGRIHVLDVFRYFFCQGFDANPFCPRTRDLRRDIYRQMRMDLDFMRETELWEYVY